MYIHLVLGEEKQLCFRVLLEDTSVMARIQTYTQITWPPELESDTFNIWCLVTERLRALVFQKL